MAFFDKNFFLRIKHMDLKVRRLVTSDLQGEYLSGFKGSGMEFDRVREYCFGDDIRGIDWNVTARMNSPYVKVYHEHRELTMMIALDVSGSLNFGSGNIFKNEKAAEVAALLAFLAAKNQDKVGFLFFSDGLEGYIPPKKGIAHIWNTLEMLQKKQFQGKKTDYQIIWKTLSQRFRKKHTLCFVISDFLGASKEELTQSFMSLNQFYDLSCIRIWTPIENNMEALGLCRFRDLESSQEILSKGQNISYEPFFRTTGISSMELSTEEDTFSAMAYFLKNRHRRFAP